VLETNRNLAKKWQQQAGNGPSKLLPISSGLEVDSDGNFRAVSA
jgi:hypothetical protein